MYTYCKSKSCSVNYTTLLFLVKIVLYSRLEAHAQIHAPWGPLAGLRDQVKTGSPTSPEESRIGDYQRVQARPRDSTSVQIHAPGF